jgi:pimeloyl-ACP methyl ester carboxylesterase
VFHDGSPSGADGHGLCTRRPNADGTSCAACHNARMATGVAGEAVELRLPGTGYVEVGGRRVRFRRLGSGEPVLLLHGIGRSLEDWSEQFDRLAGDFDLVAVDLPGFGWSDPLPGGTRLAGLAASLPPVLEALGLRGPVHVVGNSLGGAVAMRLAADRPEVVRSLLLANSAGFGSEVTIGLRLLAIRPLSRWLLKPNRRAAARAVRNLFPDPAVGTEDRVELAYAVASQPNRAEAMLAIADELGTFRGIRREWREDLLTAVERHRIPTLVLWGERDTVLPAAHLRAVSAVLPHAETHLFAQAGHMPQIERPDEFAALAGAFLRRHPLGERR